MKTSKIIYWSATILFAGFMILSNMDKLGTAGLFLTALFSPCCFPIFAFAASALGLGSFELFGVWTMWNNKRTKMHGTCDTCTTYNGKTVELKSTISCPNCGHMKNEIMPTDACVYFYECENCKTRLKPLPGDCCVYCSYGTVKCPPIQTGTSCC